MACGAGGVAHVGGEALADGGVGVGLGGLFQGRDVGRRRWGRGAEHLVQHEEAAFYGAGAGGVAGERQDCAHGEDAASRRAGGQSDASECIAFDVGHAVERRELGVEECVAAVDELQHAPTRPQDIAEEERGFLGHGGAELVVVIREACAIDG